jgi:hypothetical protein
MPETQAKVTVDSKEIRASTLPRSLTDDYRKKLGELIELEPAQRARLKKWIKARIDEWVQDTDTLHRRLEEDNDLVEGVVMETDFPFEGASNVHVPVTEMYMEVYKSVEKRSILGADLLWYGETDADELKDLLEQVENMMNYKARNEWNIEKCLANVFWTTNRDGLGILQITWSEEYESAQDVILITGPEDFAQEFPSAEEAGKTEEEFVALREQAATEASPEFPLEVPITFENQIYYGCKGEVVELRNFITIPATVPDIKDQACRGYGKRFFLRRGTVRKKASDGVFYEEAVEKILKKQGGAKSLDAYTQSKDDIEGLSRSNTKDDFEFMELAVKGRLDGDDEDEEKWYLVTWSHEHEEVMQVMVYPYRVPFYALFRINERPNRLIGRSIPQKTRDLNDEIDTQHNQRINTRTISSVPSFKALDSAKMDLDPKLKQNKWGPGVIFWLADFESFEQFKVQPTDQGESLQEEQNDFKILDLYLGSAVALLSGSTAPGDPNAPGNKTAIMIQQSNLRMDDPLEELREGVSETGNICLSHLYQFGPPILEFQEEIEAQGGVRREARTLHKKFLRRGIRLKMKGITVTNNPDAEMQKLFQLYQTLMADPLFQQNAQGRWELLHDALRAGRLSGTQRYLPSPDELKQQQVELQKQALLQMQQEKEAAAAQAQTAQVKNNLDTANQDLKIKSTAEKLAQHSLALNGAAAPESNAGGAPQ